VSHILVCIALCQSTFACPISTFAAQLCSIHLKIYIILLKTAFSRQMHRSKYPTVPAHFDKLTIQHTLLHCTACTDTSHNNPSSCPTKPMPNLPGLLAAPSPNLQGSCCPRIFKNVQKHITQKHECTKFMMAYRKSLLTKSLSSETQQMDVSPFLDSSLVCHLTYTSTNNPVFGCP
jgi:hypothetical protein